MTTSSSSLKKFFYTKVTNVYFNFSLIVAKNTGNTSSSLLSFFFSFCNKEAEGILYSSLLFPLKVESKTCFMNKISSLSWLKMFLFLFALKRVVRAYIQYFRLVMNDEFIFFCCDIKSKNCKYFRKIYFLKLIYL